MPANNVPENSKARVADLLRAGVPPAEVARQTGVALGSFYRIAGALRVPIPPPTRRARAERLLREGRSYREVAEQTGVSRGTCRRLTKKLGLPLRTGSKPVSDEAPQLVLQLLREGKSVSQVRRLARVAWGTACIIAEAHGIATAEKPPVPAQARAEAERLLREGLRTREVAERVDGIGETSCRNLARDLDLPKHPPGRPPLTALQHSTIRRVYADHGTLGACALAAGCSIGPVWQHLNEEGLLRPSHVRGELTPEELAEVLSAVREGKLPWEIAKQIGAPLDLIRKALGY